MMTEDSQFVDLKGSGEEATFSSEEMSTMLELGRKGIRELSELQRQAVHSALGEADGDAAHRLADHFNQS